MSGIASFVRLSRQRDVMSSALMGRDKTGYLGEVNALHPFREGNGRAQRVFFGQLAATPGSRSPGSTLIPFATSRPLPRSCVATQNRRVRCSTSSSGTTPDELRRGRDPCCRGASSLCAMGLHVQQHPVGSTAGPVPAYRQQAAIRGDQFRPGARSSSGSHRVASRHSQEEFAS